MTLVLANFWGFEEFELISRRLRSCGEHCAWAQED